jgi:hypothetical protein
MTIPEKTARQILMLDIGRLAYRAWGGKVRGQRVSRLTLIRNASWIAGCDLSLSLTANVDPDKVPPWGAAQVRHCNT